MADISLPHRFAEVPAPDLTARRAAQLDEGSAATFDKADHDKASRYQADASLTAAVNAAIVLSKPLLLMGPPGTGKTELARALAWQLDIPLYKFETKSSSQSRDLFYTYDSLRAFSDRDSQIDHRKYLSFQALGRAILDAVSGDDPQRKVLEGDAASGAAARRSVVLIDEIDKAPRDFPNDLLNEIEHLYFKVPELHRNAQSPGGKDIAPAMRPIVIITSNDERGLPAPFLRRCLFHHIAFPDPDRMRAIVRAHLKLGDAQLPQALDALVTIFYSVHQALEAQGSPPSTSEILDWIAYLVNNGLDLDKPLAAQRQAFGASAAILGKSRVAAEKVAALLEETLTGPAR